MQTRISRSSFFLAAAILAAPALSFATDYYVAPNGSGNGSIGSPWSIDTVCAGSSAARPGDTVWLRAGNYGSGGHSTINCQVNGSASAPLIIRAYPGERATILGGLGVYSNYVWYWGIEIQNSFTRSTTECGSFPSIKPPDGVFFTQGATGNKFINMIIHDVANGIADQQEAIGTEDYGNLIYNVGWASSCDRGHGHALYLQNNGSSVKLVQDNLGWNSFDIGMQAYSGGANVSNLWFVGNAFWNNGLPGGHRVDNLYIGASASPKQNILVQDSVMYNPLDATEAETGYNQADSGSNFDITLKNNYWIGANPTGYVTLLLSGWQTTNVTGNMFVGPLSINGIGAYNWSGNSYYKSAPPSGADTASPVSGSYPTGVRVLVRPNKYEQGRANIVVLNFDKSSTVSVDLSNSGLTAGQSYEIRDAQNFWGGPVVTGVYNGGAISLPMSLNAVSAMINGTTPAHTSSEFGAFVVLPSNGSASILPPSQPAPSVAISVNPPSANLTSGQTQQLTASVTGSSNTAVSWSLNPAVGSISANGLYTAPPTISASQSVTVTATSQADTSKSATATITVNPPVAAPPTVGGIAGSWSFDTAEISGATVVDGSGNGLNGVLSNATAVAGRLNQALSFNGSNSVVTVNSNGKLDLANSMTISAWVKTANNSRTEDVLGKYDATGTEWGWILKVLPSGVVGLRVGGNNTNGVRDVVDATPVNDGQWHHVAVVVNLGSNVQFYIDGSLRSTQGMPTKAAGNTSPLWIGTIPFNYFGMPFTGSLDSVRVDSQALSASAIAAIVSSAGAAPVPTPAPTPAPAPTPTPTPTPTPAPSPVSVSAGPPSIGSLTPFAGTGGSATFTVSFSDPNGWANIASAEILINTDRYAQSGCYVRYLPAGNSFQLINDAGTAAGPLANSQCTLSGATASGAGNTLTVTLPLSFQPGFGSPIAKKTIFLQATDAQGVTAPWLAMGIWYPAGQTGTATAWYRLYDPYSRSHAFTTDLNEYNTLGTRGYTQEGSVGQIYNAPGNLGSVPAVPLWRIAVVGSQSHFWTADRNEYVTLIQNRGAYVGEGADGFVFLTPPAGAVPLMRLSFVPSGGGIHHWTTDVNEYNVLGNQGWSREGVAAYLFPQ